MAEKESGRVEAFSDGIFAFAITLLVLDLKVPQLGDYHRASELGSALTAQWPSFAAYLISFSTILIMWVNHHNLFNWIQKIDSRLMFLNGLLLLFISVLPFPTALLSEHIQKPGAQIAGAVFCGAYFLIAIAYNLLWRHLYCQRKKMMPSMHDHHAARITTSYNSALLCYALAWASCFVSIYIGVAIVAALAAYFAVFSYEDKEI